MKRLRGTTPGIGKKEKDSQDRRVGRLLKDWLGGAGKGKEDDTTLGPRKGPE